MRAKEQKQNAKNHLKAFSYTAKGAGILFREQHFLVISFHVFPRHLIVASSRIIQRRRGKRASAAHLTHSARFSAAISFALFPSFFLLAGALNFENYGSISFHFPKQYLSSLLILLSEFLCKIESTRAHSLCIGMKHAPREKEGQKGCVVCGCRPFLITLTISNKQYV